MFSQPVRHVSRTRIFARGLAAGRQLLVYSMHLDADGDLAMVLPVPSPPSSPEDAVRFVDMSACPTFFDQLAAMFPFDGALMGGDLPAQFGAPRALLRVHAVGDFVASFVPTRADFDRLDPRFRLPTSVWDAMPGYADWGYCVFQLRSLSGPEAPPADPPGLVARVQRFFAGDAPAHTVAPTDGATRKYHPMAFEFPRRDASSLFFPTKHVHDGAVHTTARYDHSLYCQVPAGARTTTDDAPWEASPVVAGLAAAGRSTAAAWLDADAPVYRLELYGDLVNRDVVARAVG